IRASCSAVNAVPAPVLQSSIDMFYRGSSEAEVRKMAHSLLRETSALTDLIYDGAGEIYRRSTSHTFFTAEGLLQQCMAKSPAFDGHPEAAFCASVVRAAMKCAYDEHRRNAEGTHQRDSDVGEGHCLYIILAEATAAAYEVCSAFSAVPVATSYVEQCKIVLHDLTEKIGASLSVLRGRSIGEIRSLGDANVYSFVLGLVADAQLLLESIDVSALPDHVQYEKLFTNIGRALCEAASICVKQQCAGNPEYGVPAECDCQNPQEWNFPSTNVAAVSLSIVADARRGYYVV
ncbi:hypothetical protein, partial [Anaplasma phagocytophilum]|uniref:hypothetical protein n=3 Tax=Anaplasma phagocytophilum TaxID=948 RepID=UPI000A53BC95